MFSPKITDPLIVKPSHYAMVLTAIPLRQLVACGLSPAVLIAHPVNALEICVQPSVQLDYTAWKDVIPNYRKCYKTGGLTFDL